MDDWVKQVEMYMGIISAAIILTIAFTFMDMSKGIISNVQTHISISDHIKDISSLESYDGKKFNAYDVYGFIMELSSSNEYYPKVTIDNKVNTDLTFNRPIKNVSPALFDTYFKNIKSIYTCKIILNGKGNIIEIRFIEG